MKMSGRYMGMSVFAFGVGCLITFFLPETVLTVLLALVIVAAGLLFIKC